VATRRTTRREPEGRAEPSFQSIVGEATYQVWVDMLRILVPGGRTHRLAPMLAGMLRYAAEQCARKGERHRRSCPLGDALKDLEEGDDDAMVVVAVAVQRLFRDAGVPTKRVSRDSESYSVVDTALHEFQRWGEMPWE
jgi:hypothetical protein